MKASLARRQLHRRLHPHPRVTAVAKQIATAAPLALSRNQAGEGSSESSHKTGTAPIPSGEGSSGKIACQILHPAGEGSEERRQNKDSHYFWARDLQEEGSSGGGGSPILEPAGRDIRQGV